MDSLKGLVEFTGQTTDELLALEGIHRTDMIVMAFQAALEQKADSLGLAALTDEERVVLAVERLQQQVNMGGYNSYFFNSSGRYAPIVVEALTRIGAKRVAAITRSAIKALGIDGELTPEKVRDACYSEDEKRQEKIDKKHMACDERFFEASEDLSVPLLAFIKKNRSCITLPKKKPRQVTGKGGKRTPGKKRAR